MGISKILQHFEGSIIKIMEEIGTYMAPWNGDMYWKPTIMIRLLWIHIQLEEVPCHLYVPAGSCNVDLKEQRITKQMFMQEP